MRKLPLANYTRSLSLHMENAHIGDGPFNLEIAQTLRNYADAIERGEAGSRSLEVFENERGTRVTAISAAGGGE